MIGRYVAIQTDIAIYHRVEITGWDRTHMTVEWWDGRRTRHREAIRHEDVIQWKEFRD